jgi:prevent-host-death family protein
MTINVVKIRSRLADTINRVKYQGERVVLERRGKGVAALISIEDLNMLEKLEDEYDVRAARAALREKGAIPWEQVKKELGLRGLGKRATGQKRKARRTSKAKA